MTKKLDLKKVLSEQEEIKIIPFSFKEVYNKLKKYWIYFVVFPAIGVTLAIVSYLSTVSKYESKAMILLNVEDDGSNAFKSLQELVSSYNPRLMYENEIVILKSNTLCLRTIESFDYEVSYYSSGLFKKNEITFKSPIKVIFDKSKPQLINADFVIYDINPSTYSFKLNIILKENCAFNYSNLKCNHIASMKKIIDKFVSENKTYNFDQWIESEIFSFKVELKPTDLTLNKVIFQFNNPFQLAYNLSKSLKFSPSAKESSGVDVFIYSNTPEKTDFLLRRHVAEYEKLGRELKNENIIKTLDFINNQIHLLQDSLRILESSIQRIRASNLIIDSKEQGVNLINKLFELDKRNSELKMIERFLESIIQSSDISGSSFNLSPQLSGINDPVINNLIQRYNLLKIQRQKLGNLNDNNPIINQLNNELSSTLLLIKSNAENLLKKNKEEIKLNNLKIGEVESKLSEIPGLEYNILSIERNYKILENIYTFFLYKRSEMEISLNFNKSNILFIDYLNSEPKKISPKLLIYMVIGGFGSFGLTLLIVVSIILLKSTIDELTNLEEFSHLNVLCSIPHNKSKHQNIVNTQPQSIIAESFRIIRSNLKFYKKPEEKCITTLITSFVPGEGKSFCSLNLATILALGGKKVLLIGADMRKPKLFEDLKAKNDIGLSTYLSGHTSLEESIQATSIENLYLISAGPIPPNPSELIITKKFELLMGHSKSLYDYIVIDTPPLLAVNDASEIMNYTDLNIIIVRKNVTQLSFLKNLESKIQKNSIQNAAIVLNDFESSPVGVGIGSQLKGYGYIVE